MKSLLVGAAIAVIIMWLGHTGMQAMAACEKAHSHETCINELK